MTVAAQYTLSSIYAVFSAWVEWESDYWPFSGYPLSSHDLQAVGQWGEFPGFSPDLEFGITAKAACCSIHFHGLMTVVAQYILSSIYAVFSAWVVFESDYWPFSGYPLSSHGLQAVDYGVSFRALAPI